MRSAKWRRGLRTGESCGQCERQSASNTRGGVRGADCCRGNGLNGGSPPNGVAILPEDEFYFATVVMRGEETRYGPLRFLEVCPQPSESLEVPPAISSSECETVATRAGVCVWPSSSR